jgi:hypothetical protein
MLLFPKKEAKKLIVPVLNHETNLWWFCKNISEEASLGFEMIASK